MATDVLLALSPYLHLNISWHAYVDLETCVASYAVFANIHHNESERWTLPSLSVDRSCLDILGGKYYAIMKKLINHFSALDSVFVKCRDRPESRLLFFTLIILLSFSCCLLRSSSVESEVFKPLPKPFQVEQSPLLLVLYLLR